MGKKYFHKHIIDFANYHQLHVFRSQVWMNIRLKVFEKKTFANRKRDFHQRSEKNSKVQDTLSR